MLSYDVPGGTIHELEITLTGASGAILSPAAGRVARLLWMKIDLHTDGTAATRTFSLYVRDSSDDISLGIYGFNLTDSSNRSISFNVNTPSSYMDATFVMDLPPLFLLYPGSELYSAIDSVKEGDYVRARGVYLDWVIP